MPNATVVLSCLHTMIYNPVPTSGVLWCSRCSDYKEYVSPGDASKYEVHCFDCRRIKNTTKVGSIGAETKAIKHSLTATGHRVGIWVDDTLDKVFYHEPVLTLDGAPPY